MYCVQIIGKGGKGILRVKRVDKENNQSKKITIVIPPNFPPLKLPLV
jgi:hypothetical protein